MSPRNKWFAMRVVRFVSIGLLVLTIVFILPRIMPGDPVENILGEASIGLTDEAREALLNKYRLNEPIWDQYIAFLTSIFTLDFGYSITRSMPVDRLIMNRLPWTIMLTLPPIIFGSILAIFTSIKCGMSQGSKLDRLLSGISIYFETIPGFLFAMVMILIFSFQLGIFPLGHLRSGEYTGIGNIMDIIYHLTLPIITLTLSIFLGKFLILRNNVIQMSHENYIFVARSKGLSEKYIERKHIMRNTMPVFLSMLIMNIGFMISGALMIEIVFSFQGMGTLLQSAITAQDYPVIQGVFIILVGWVLFTNLFAEFIYGIADPRIGDSIDKRSNL
jgi:ABC-type dipeptide/oligopeptide/nickel transport systems, permease components